LHRLLHGVKVAFAARSIPTPQTVELTLVVDRVETEEEARHHTKSSGTWRAHAAQLLCLRDAFAGLVYRDPAGNREEKGQKGEARVSLDRWMEVTQFY
jgi:hypothetical protein